MNKVVLTGRITRDPEIRYTTAGIPSVMFSLAVDRNMRDANGNRQADFINCVAWRGQAEFISRYIKKGYLLAVEGRIQTRQYQTQDGQTRYVTEVVADNVENLQPRDSNAAVQGGYQTQPAGQQQPVFQPNPYQGYNNPSYGANNSAQPSYQQPAKTEAPQTFNVDVADDDLPF